MEQCWDRKYVGESAETHQQPVQLCWRREPETLWRGETKDLQPNCIAYKCFVRNTPNMWKPCAYVHRKYTKISKTSAKNVLYSVSCFLWEAIFIQRLECLVSIYWITSIAGILLCVFLFLSCFFVLLLIYFFNVLKQICFPWFDCLCSDQIAAIHMAQTRWMVDLLLLVVPDHNEDQNQEQERHTSRQTLDEDAKILAEKLDRVSKSISR